MRELLFFLWALLAITLLWWFSAKALFPWIDEKRAQRDPVKNPMFLDDMLKEKD